MKKSLRTTLFMLFLILVQVCGCCRKGPSALDTEKKQTAEKTSGEAVSDISDKPKAAVFAVKSNKSTFLKQKNFSVSSSKKTASSLPFSSAFMDEYSKGIDLMEAGRLFEAADYFKKIRDKYQGYEEASVIDLCLADIAFRNKDDARAIKLYEAIVEQYPSSQAAENARAAIEFLKNFEIYAQNHEPPCASLKRRGFR